MFYNLKSAFRNLRCNGFYSVLNGLGLAISLAACVFILLYVLDEKSYDRFHSDPEAIWQGVSHFKSDGGIESSPRTPGQFALTAAQDYPEVESFCRVNDQGVRSLQVGENKIEGRRILYADSTFFSFFAFPILKGETEHPLQIINNVVISESLALALFQNMDPLGHVIRMNDKEELRVVAVMRDFPANTNLPHADMVCSLRSDQSLAEFGDMTTSWGSSEYEAFFRLQPGTDVDRLAKELTGKQTVFQDFRSFTLQPLVDRHLYTLAGEPAGIRMVNLFQWIAVIILCIACVNYVNLITSRFSKRQYEISLRKILGARRSRLFSQLMLEAGMLFLFALVVAVILNLLLLPAYNQLSGKMLTLNWTESRIWILYGGMFLSVLLLAGLYPAWLFSSFRPAKKMKETRGGVFFRRSLIVLQFAASFALITGTVVLQSQMSYIRNKDLGYDRSYVFTCPMNAMDKHYTVIRSELLKNTAIKGVTSAFGDVVDVQDGHSVSNWQGKTRDGKFHHGRFYVDSTFFSTMHIQFVEGGSFHPAEYEPFVINEAAVRAMGMQEPVVGKWMDASGGVRGTIVGVVKDFNFRSLHQTIEPMVMRNGTFGSLYVRTSAKDASRAIASVEKLWKQYNPDKPFVYNFLDDTFNRMYESEQRMGRMFAIFSFLAILISCLGLLGLVTFTAETKTKEIGIRKVLGAGVSDIVSMLSKEFLVLVCIAMLIAFPLAYYWLDKLLQDYAYRISIGWWMFALAALITVGLTIIAVGWQAVKAATANPVKSIKSE